MRTPEKDAIMNSRLVTLTIVLLGWWMPLRVSAQLTPAEQALLNRLDVARTVAVTRRFSEEIVDNRSGVGAGSVVAGSADEKLVANVIEQEFRNMGITSVRQEPFPVRHYEYGEVVLTADGEPIEAVSLHAAGGTWGTRDGVPYARGNDGDGRRVRAELVDAGDGYLADYVEAGDVRGKVVLVRRGNGWPTYQILEAAHRGALALILYDYVSSLEEALKQDSMWYHEQLATVSIRKRDASRLLDELKAGPVEIVLENRIDVADGTSQNVVATILGTELPDEWIVVSAHYDRWFQAAADNSVGVAVMLELARAFSSDYTPRRSLMFVGAGAEEAGVEATESDWLAGSLAFVRAHPEVTRSMAFAFNVDLAGWTADTGAVNGTHDALPFLRQVVADLGTGGPPDGSRWDEQQRGCLEPRIRRRGSSGLPALGKSLRWELVYQVLPHPTRPLPSGGLPEPPARPAHRRPERESDRPGRDPADPVHRDRGMGRARIGSRP